MGVSEERFWDGNPTDLKPYVTAFNNAIKRRDAEMWQMGIYINNAVHVAVARNLHGRKAGNVKYIDKPLMEQQEEKSKQRVMTESEIKKKREEFLMQLQIMEINFNNTHPVHDT